MCGRAGLVSPDSGECIFNGGKGVTAVHVARGGHSHEGYLLHKSVANTAYSSCVRALELYLLGYSGYLPIVPDDTGPVAVVVPVELSGMISTHLSNAIQVLA